MDFITIDVETANADMASICQIGMCHFKGKTLVDELNLYINPKTFFDDNNVAVHGITNEMVSQSPVFLDIADRLDAFVSDLPVFSHTAFDKTAINKTAKAHNYDLGWEWFDSAKLVRHFYDEFAFKGYGLANLCRMWGFDFKHHDAIEDARACGFVVNYVANDTNKSFEELFDALLYHKKQFASYKPVSKEGNPHGSFYGESVCFTGQLSMSRQDAAELASQAGLRVKTGVTKNVEYLVVGEQDITLLAGKNKSSKHLKAEQLRASGHNILILQEKDFIEMIKNH